MSSTSSRVYLVTGGTSGIGLAFLKKVVLQGERVVTCGRRPFDFSKVLDDEALSRIWFEQMDLGLPGNGRRLIQTALDRFGQVDVLINNAAVAPMKPLVELTDQDFLETANVNMRAVFETTQAVFPHLLSRSGGVIVNLSSMAAVDPFTGFSIYGASKAWIETFTRAVADEGRDRDVACYAIRAGTVETPLLRSVLPDFPADQALQPNEVAEFIWQLIESRDLSRSGDAVEVSYRR